MSGGKKKKSSSGTKSGGKKASSSKEKVKDTFFEESENVEDVIENSNTSSTSSSTKSPSSSTTANDADAFAANPSVDVLDRLAPPILFFPPNVAEEYLNRFCPVPQSVHGPPENSLLADEGFPDREIPVMRRLLAMMAGIMSKASAASARTYFSRVAGTEGRRNGYFQQNLNTSVFNLFSTLSAAGNPQAGDINININNNEKDLHLNPASAFTAKDGEPLRGYPTRLMKFWRQLSPTEQLRLVKEEHAALTNSWIESRQNWCLCAHCKHRRMTISDLTDCLYQTYCEELEAFLNSGGQGSTLYSPNLTNSMEPAAKARRFLFKSLSVVGEQALLPRYNQFILRLDAFSSMAFSMKDNNKERKNSHKMKIPSDIKNEIKNGLKSAALQASKDFLQMQGKNAIEIEEFMSEKFLPPPSENLKKMSKAFDNPLEGLSIKVIRGSDDEDCIMLDRPNSSDSEISENEGSDLDDDEDDRESHQGGIQSEDDDDLIDEETDLPIDESELMLPGGASFPLLPAGDGPVQWSESSRIECGRTVFLMFASEMFQYRLTAAYLAHQTKLRQMKLLAEVEEEERLEKEKRAKEERERKEKMEADKKKKAAKKEKAAAKANGGNKTAKKLQTPAAAKKPVVESKNESESESEVETQVVAELGEENMNNIDVAVELEPEPIEIESVIVVEPASPITIVAEPVSVTIDQPKPQSQSSVTNENDSLLSSPLFPPTHKPPLQQPATTVTVDDDDFDPTLLVEQLSKEMNHFELYGDKSGLNTNPPGFAPPPGFAAAEPKHLDGRVGGGGEEGGQYRYSGRPPFSLDYEGFYGYVSDGFNSHPSTNPNLQTYPQVQQQQMFMPPGYHQNPQPYDHFQGHPNFGYPTSSYNHQQSYPPPHTPSEYHNSLFNPIYYNRPPPPPPPPPQNQHQHQQDEVLEQGQSRFQSFFSKSIFGPSSFFSQ